MLVFFVIIDCFVFLFLRLAFLFVSSIDYRFLEIPLSKVVKTGGDLDRLPLRIVVDVSSTLGDCLDL